MPCENNNKIQNKIYKNNNLRRSGKMHMQARWAREKARRRMWALTGSCTCIFEWRDKWSFYLSLNAWKLVVCCACLTSRCHTCNPMHIDVAVVWHHLVKLNFPNNEKYNFSHIFRFVRRNFDRCLPNTHFNFRSEKKNEKNTRNSHEFMCLRLAIVTSDLIDFMYRYLIKWNHFQHNLCCVH